MAEFRLIISDPSKKRAHKMEVSGAQANKLFGLGIGGVGYHPKKTGIRRRKSVRGRVISAETGQINLVVGKSGAKPLDEILKAEKAE